jgi:hypothetical protein
MIDLFVIYTLLADASMDHFPHPLPPIEYYQETGVDRNRQRFEAQEKVQDEIFFRDPDANKDRNAAFFPHSTIPKKAE